MAGEECKDSEGNWTKWVIERCTEEEKQAYEEMSELCKQDPLVSWTSENHKLRFLQGYKFDVDAAFKALMDAETWRYENNADTLTQDDIRANLDMKSYGICGQDKDGRYIVYCRASNLIPELTTPNQSERYMMYFLDSVVSKLPPNHDSIIMIYDVAGVGYKNFSKDIGLALISTASKVFIGTMKKQIVLNSGFTVKMLWNVLSPFIHERSKKKF